MKVNKNYELCRSSRLLQFVCVFVWETGGFGLFSCQHVCVYVCSDWLTEGTVIGRQEKTPVHFLGWLVTVC